MVACTSSNCLSCGVGVVNNARAFIDDGTSIYTNLQTQWIDWPRQWRRALALHAWLAGWSRLRFFFVRCCCLVVAGRCAFVRCLSCRLSRRSFVLLLLCSPLLFRRQTIVTSFFTLSVRSFVRSTRRRRRWPPFSAAPRRSLPARWAELLDDTSAGTATSCTKALRPSSGTSFPTTTRYVVVRRAACCMAQSLFSAVGDGVEREARH